MFLRAGLQCNLKHLQPQCERSQAEDDDTTTLPSEDCDGTSEKSQPGRWVVPTDDTTRVAACALRDEVDREVETNRKGL